MSVLSVHKLVGERTKNNKTKQNKRTPLYAQIIYFAAVLICMVH